MTSVITGDIIHSRTLQNQDPWLIPLKKLFNEYGKTPKVWEIYRGDSFQVEVKDPADALLTAIRIKATVKCVKGIDVRMGIGIGGKDYEANRVSESNGEAFVHSGERLESMKKEKQNLSVKTPWPAFDEEINLHIRLALIAMDNWSQGAAELMTISLANRTLGQQEIAEKLGIAQSSVSERQTRAHHAEIMDLEAWYREKINKLIRQ
ncbi:MAG: transcriptional regulator [Flavobacteriales bacterium]|nr:transcriptional regulator [Flavobacteriales bacterium]